MNREAILPLSILVGILLGLAVVIVAPSSMPYSMANEGPHGYSQLHTLLNAEPFNARENIDELDTNTTAIIVSRDQPLGNTTLQGLYWYIYNGGLVIATGSPSYLDSLLQGLGVNASVWDVRIYDMVYNAGNRSLVNATTTCGYSLVLDTPRPLNGSLTRLAYTSNYSYADKDWDGYMGLTEETTSYTVAGSYKLGRGTLIVVSSPYAFTNAFIHYNKAFLECITGGRKLYVDQSLLSSNPLEYFKLQIKYQPSRETRLMATLIAGVVGVVAYAVAKRI